MAPFARARVPLELHLKIGNLLTVPIQFLFFFKGSLIGLGYVIAEAFAGTYDILIVIFAIIATVQTSYRIVFVGQDFH